MNQKLSDWASFAEIIASFSVVITLIVLILGVRENSDIVRASAYSNSIQGINDWQSTVLGDPDAVRVWTAMRNNDMSDLSGEDQSRLLLIFLTSIRAYESAYLSGLYGLLGDAEWRRFESEICYTFGRIRSSDFEDVIRGIVTEEFLRYVDSECFE